jgi:hypothetical protein
MRNFELDEKDPLKVWIRESGAESPSAGFQLNILKKLSAQALSKPYEPVISNFAMKIIGGLLIVFFITVLLFIPASESSLSFWNQLPEYTFPMINLSLPALIFPKIGLGAVFKISIVIFSLMAFCIAILAGRRWRYL